MGKRSFDWDYVITFIIFFGLGLVFVLLFVALFANGGDDVPGELEVPTHNMEHTYITIDGMQCIYIDNGIGAHGKAGLSCDWRGSGQ